MGSILEPGNDYLKIIRHPVFVPYRGDIRHPKGGRFLFIPWMSRGCQHSLVSSGPELSSTWSYTSILRLGLMAGDTPDIPGCHLGTRRSRRYPIIPPRSDTLREVIEAQNSSSADQVQRTRAVIECEDRYKHSDRVQIRSPAEYTIPR
ncbi:hypothetical protein F511_33192 [Dorcoceras hygrometricum]|uniref:Uncharacterized protein n=1 Tax=Dorcoceras hygrometricum TaxID=472368 RepID=A0A2Z7CWA7_9LAMI|nr:hypothetical protein F511_33192 [Dorcoceras hygrometricum]